MLFGGVLVNMLFKLISLLNSGQFLVHPSGKVGRPDTPQLSTSNYGTQKYLACSCTNICWECTPV